MSECKKEQFMNSMIVRAINLLAVFSLLLSSVTVAHGQQASARIKIDIDRTIGEVDPLLFGNFSEHLGRMIYGGIYEEGSPLSDANGYRKDVMEAGKNLNVSILRWPGGKWVTKTRKSMRSLPSKPPKPCTRSIEISNSSPAAQATMERIGLPGIAPSSRY